MGAKLKITARGPRFSVALKRRSTPKMKTAWGHSQLPAGAQSSPMVQGSSAQSRTQNGTWNFSPVIVAGARTASWSVCTSAAAAEDDITPYDRGKSVIISLGSVPWSLAQ
ncbi:hypothetical protein COCON_G00226110 [Conger conger]|uniref:Uncharacterized protein n=1 Tax=Conger conger TaxID=82655 RepID=A0A9Q1CWZ3_CONCO|nr:hypothetical protein COCON_G00226110 [Conger conger]